MRKLAIVAVGLLAVSCGEDAKPCTTCIDVQGNYLVAVGSKAAELSTCSRLAFNGFEENFELYQTGSELELPLLFGGLKGVLDEKYGAHFDPVQVEISNTDPVAYATLSISGSFTGEEYARVFNGGVVASAVLDGTVCSLTTTLRMTRQ